MKNSKNVEIKCTYSGEKKEYYNVFLGGEKLDIKILFQFDDKAPQCVLYHDKVSDGLEFDTENEGMLYLEKLLNIA